MQLQDVEKLIRNGEFGGRSSLPLTLALFLLG